MLFSNANTWYVTTVTFKDIVRRDMKMRSATCMIRQAVRDGQHRVQTDAASSRNKQPWAKRMRPTGRPASDGREGNQKRPLQPLSRTGFMIWIQTGKHANSITTRPIGLTAFNCSIIIQSHLKNDLSWKDSTRHMPKQLAPPINPEGLSPPMVAIPTQVNPSYVFKIHFGIILPSTPKSWKWSLPTYKTMLYVASFILHPASCSKRVRKPFR